MQRIGTVRVHENNIGVWEETVNEDDYRKAVFVPLQAFLKGRGWEVSADPHVLKHYRSISKDNRIATKGPLRAALRLGGRHIEFVVWSEDYATDHGAGHQYDTNDIRNRAPVTTRLRLDNEIVRVSHWLGCRFGYAIDHDHDPRLETEGGAAW